MQEGFITSHLATSHLGTCSQNKSHCIQSVDTWSLIDCSVVIRNCTAVSESSEYLEWILIMDPKLSCFFLQFRVLSDDNSSCCYSFALALSFGIYVASLLILTSIGKYSELVCHGHGVFDNCIFKYVTDLKGYHIFPQ